MVLASGGLSGGDVAGLIVAVFWAVLVVFISYLLLRLGKVVGEAARLVRGVADQTMPLLGEMTTSVSHVNDELTRVDAITANVQDISGNVSTLTAVLATSLGSPVIRIASFSYGVRRALSSSHRADLRSRTRDDRRAARGGNR